MRGSAPKSKTLDLQVDSLKKAGCSKIYTEKVSGGATADRPELAKVLDNVRSGDVLVIPLLFGSRGDGAQAYGLTKRRVRLVEIGALLRGQLPPGRAQELQHEMLAVGIPI